MGTRKKSKGVYRLGAHFKAIDCHEALRRVLPDDAPPSGIASYCGIRLLGDDGIIDALNTSGAEVPDYLDRSGLLLNGGRDVEPPAGDGPGAEVKARSGEDEEEAWERLVAEVDEVAAGGGEGRPEALASPALGWAVFRTLYRDRGKGALKGADEDAKVQKRGPRLPRS